MRDSEGERNDSENLKVDWMIILKCIPKSREGAWSELMWLRIRTGGELL